MARREPPGAKLLPGRLGVDRGDRQQEVERSRDLVDAAVHPLDRFDEDAPPQGLMGGRADGPTERETPRSARSKASKIVATSRRRRSG